MPGFYRSLSFPHLSARVGWVTKLLPTLIINIKQQIKGEVTKNEQAGITCTKDDHMYCNHLIDL